MKSRVKATGEIVRIEGYGSVFHYGKLLDGYIDTEGVKYLHSELEFDVKEKSLPKDEPDYWGKLKHQYAGMAMQGILANPETIGLDDIDVAATAIRIANITVTKLKEESQCEK